MADPAALVATRLAVGKASDALITRPTFTTLDESKGSQDYLRWRRDLISFVTPAGQDFVRALQYAGSAFN